MCIFDRSAEAPAGFGHFTYDGIHVSFYCNGALITKNETNNDCTWAQEQASTEGESMNFWMNLVITNCDILLKTKMTMSSFCCSFSSHQGPQNVSDPDVVGGGGHPGSYGPSQLRHGRQSPPEGLLFKVHHLNCDVPTSCDWPGQRHLQSTSLFC